MFITNFAIFILIVAWINGNEQTKIFGQNGRGLEKLNWTSRKTHVLLGNENNLTGNKDASKRVIRISRADTTTNENLCLIDNICNILVRLGTCVLKLKEMDAKCPSYCQKCHTDWENEGEEKLENADTKKEVDVDNEDYLPDIIKNNKELIDDEFNKTINDYGLHYRQEFVNFVVTSKANFKMPQDGSPKELFTGLLYNYEEVKKGAGGILSKLQKPDPLPLNSPLIGYPLYHMVVTPKTDMREFLKKFSKETNENNRLWKKGMLIQYNIDRERQTARAAEKAFWHAVASITSAIPEVGGAINGLITTAFNLKYDIENIWRPPLTLGYIETLEIKRRLTQQTDLTMQIALIQDAKLKALLEMAEETRKNLFKYYQLTVKGFNIMEARMNIMIRRLSDQSGTQTLLILGTIYTNNYGLKTNILMKGYNEYIKGKMLKNSTQRLLEICRANSPAMLLKTMQSTYDKNGLLNLAKQTSGIITKIRKDVYTVYTDAMKLKQVATACASIQNKDENEICEDIYDINLYSLNLQHSVVTFFDTYYETSATVINDKIKEFIQNLKTKDVAKAVVEITDILSNNFVELRFYVHASNNGSGEPEVSYADDNLFHCKVKHNTNGIIFFVLWYSVRDDPTGEMWDHCSAKESNEEKYWFISRPRCIKANLKKHKTTAYCKDTECVIQVGDAIPTCQSQNNRQPCFEEAPLDAQMDPSVYVNSLSEMNPAVTTKRQRYNITEMMNAKTMYKMLKTEMEALNLDYCIHATVSFTSNKYEPTLNFATTMNGATFPWAYYTQNSEKLITYNKKEVLSKFDEEIKILDDIRKILDRRYKDFDEICDSLDYNNYYNKICISQVQMAKDLVHSMLKRGITEIENEKKKFSLDKLDLEKQQKSNQYPPLYFANRKIHTLNTEIQIYHQRNKPYDFIENVIKNNLKMNTIKTFSILKRFKFKESSFFGFRAIKPLVNWIKQIVIYRKCPKLAMNSTIKLSADLKKNCTSKLKNVTNLKEKFETQMAKFVKKVEKKHDKEKLDKILKIVLPVFGCLLLVGIATAGVAVILQRRSKSSNKMVGVDGRVPFPAGGKQAKLGRLSHTKLGRKSSEFSQDEKLGRGSSIKRTSSGLTGKGSAIFKRPSNLSNKLSRKSVGKVSSTQLGGKKLKQGSSDKIVKNTKLHRPSKEKFPRKSSDVIRRN